MTVELISVHVAKTAGMSFIETLAAVYGRANIVVDLEDRIVDPASPYNLDPERRDLFRQKSIDAISLSVKVIHGHFHAAKYTAAFPSARRIVWIRNPVARLVSNYYYWMSFASGENIDHSLHRYAVREKLKLMEFARLPYMRNIMARRYFEGLDLSYFHFVGVYEHFRDDMNDLGRLLGWPPAEVPSRNMNLYDGYKDKKEEILSNQKLVRDLEELNQDDMELYRQTLEQRENRIKARVID